MYTALYRKLRPSLFAEVVGQEHIVTTLRNQLVSGRVSHAYLFCGTRGTGKTSTAKILARSVNCENPANGEPCNACASCESILSGRGMNVLEIDAASNNGVDNIRDIREEVRYAPAEGKYRVYIIDEVHMLSAGAFNALLKTLEEPPGYVMFILATTDPQKIPATVLSRVQRFDFRRISAKDMQASLKGYMAGEGLSVDDDALAYVAGVSDGAMRDALSILDQCVSYYQGRTVTLSNVLDILGAVDSQALFNMAWALSKYDSAACLTFIDEMAAAGRDMGQFIADMTLHFRNLLMSLHVGAGSTALAYSAETVERLRAQASAIPQATLLEYVRAFSELQNDARYAVNQRVLLEVLCLKLCNPAATENAAGPEAVLRRLQKLEAAMAGGLAPATARPAGHEPEPSAAEPVPAETTPETISAAPPRAEAEVSAGAEACAPQDVLRVIENWGDFANAQPIVLGSLLKTAAPCHRGGGALTIVSDNKLLRSREGEIKKALADMFHKDINIVFLSEEDGGGKPQKPGGESGGAFASAETGPTFTERDFTDKIDGIIFDDE